MRACGRCGYDNSDHLVYCCSCGRRMDRRAGGIAPSPRSGTPLGATAAGAAGTGRGPAPTAFATTVALSNVRGKEPIAGSGPARSGALAQGFDALRYVFVYARSRIDAKERTRALIDERDGARRLLAAALSELGRIVLHEAPGTPELAPLMDGVARTEARRQAAISDLAAAEKFQAAEDLRLGAEQTAAENEWKACDRGAGEVDKNLQRLDDERRTVDADILRRDNLGSPVSDQPDHRRQALADKRAKLDEAYALSRERAAALRASTIAARARLDQAVAARRRAVAAIAASLLAHARERADAERELGELTARLGRQATDLRVALPAALPGYARVDRLEETIADRDRQLAGMDGTRSRYDIRKLAAGLGLLTAILGAVGASVWALLR